MFVSLFVSPSPFNLRPPSLTDKSLFPHQLLFFYLSSHSMVAGILVQMVVMIAYTLILLEFSTRYLLDRPLPNGPWRPFSSCCSGRRRKNRVTTSSGASEMTQVEHEQMRVMRGTKEERNARWMMGALLGSTTLIFVRSVLVSSLPEPTPTHTITQRLIYLDLGWVGFVLQIDLPNGRAARWMVRQARDGPSALHRLGRRHDCPLVVLAQHPSPDVPPSLAWFGGSSVGGRMQRR